GRRPAGDSGDSATVRVEGAENTGTLRVGQSLDQARHLAQPIKQCILASPLAVSQYLPAGLTFDVVIFDEAGRISLADAINGIYRGGSVILAGDQKQLPPAILSSSALSDGDQRPAEFEAAAEPESVFDVPQRSGAFGNLPLRWHYRSRHAALIAFSNEAFYDGRLLPVPGRGAQYGPDGPRAGADGPEGGIELFCGEGTYRSR